MKSIRTSSLKHQLARQREVQKTSTTSPSSPGESSAELCSSGKGSKVNQYISFQTAASALGFTLMDTACWSSKSDKLASCRPLALLELSPTDFSNLLESGPPDFQSQTLWELVFLVEILRARHARCGVLSHHPSIPHSLLLVGWGWGRA